MGEDGLRTTPESCFPCLYKTPCLRSAMRGIGGYSVKEEIIDRAYRSGRMGFMERWAKKKDLHLENLQQYEGRRRACSK